MGTREAYVIKLDIQGYFMSLPRKGVYERICFGLEKQFSDDRLWLKDLLKYLWGEVIFDDPTKEVKIRGSVLEWAALPPSKSLFH